MFSSAFLCSCTCGLFRSSELPLTLFAGEWCCHDFGSTGLQGSLSLSLSLGFLLAQALLYLLAHPCMIRIIPLLSVLCLAIPRGRPNIQRCHVFHYPVFSPHLHSMEGTGLRQSTKEDLFWYSMFRHSGNVSQPPHVIQHYNFSNHLSLPKHLPNLR